MCWKVYFEVVASFSYYLVAIVLFFFFSNFGCAVNSQVCLGPRVQGSHPSSRWWGRC